MAYTEFYCDFTNGSNLNAGSTNAAASLTYASGDWVQATRVFTVASGNPLSDGVAVGDFVSVYANGSTTTGYVARVTARDATTITTSATAMIGTAPTDGTGTRTLHVGGYWKGPNAAEDFPLDLISSSLTDASTNYPRVNLKNNATYAITAACAPNQAGPVTLQGFTSSAGDGGQAIIDGGTSGASFNLITHGGTGDGWHYENITFQNNGSTGTATLLGISSADAITFRRCKFDNSVGNIFTSAAGCHCCECEFTGYNQSNTADGCAISSSGRRITLERCYFHDPDAASANTHAVSVLSGQATILNCIFDTATKGTSGFGVYLSTGNVFASGCDFYSNSGDGIRQASGNASTYLVVANSNFCNNAGWGINSLTAATGLVLLEGNGYGSGTAANTSGTSSLKSGNIETGAVAYAANLTPWRDPANGDFTIVIAAAKGAGRGTLATGVSANCVSYPSIGAVQDKTLPQAQHHIGI